MKIFFDISNYGKLSRNIEKLISELNRLNIRHSAQSVDKWQDCGKIISTNRSDEENKEVFGNCCEPRFNHITWLCLSMPFCC